MTGNSNGNIGFTLHRNAVLNGRDFPVFSVFWFAKKCCKLCLDKQMDANFQTNLISRSGKVFYDIEDGDSIFISFPRTINVQLWQKIINTCAIKQIKLDFIFLDEPIIHPNFIQILLPYAKGIFLVNHVVKQSVHPLVHPFPIGLSHLSTINFCQEFQRDVDGKDIFCLMLFKPHHGRDKLVSLYRDKKWITNYVDNPPTDPYVQEKGRVFAGGNNHLSVQGFYTFLERSKFVLDPPGCGIATHRFWEALYFNAIPVVCRTGTPIDNMYEQFPCVIVNDWKEVTKELLDDCYEDKYKQLVEFKQENPGLFTDPKVILDFFRKIV